MYILKVHNSEKDHSIVVPFTSKESAITCLKDQYQEMTTRFKKNKRNYLRFDGSWNSDYKSLEEYFEAFLLNQETSLYLSIQYLISSELNEKLHSENIPREEVISWEINPQLRTTDPEVMKLMIDPRYEFECNISTENLSDADICGAAFIWYNNFGVEYNLCVDEKCNSSAIYKMTASNSDNFETDHDQYLHYEIDPNDPYWKKDLEVTMCQALIQLHHLNFYAKKEDVDELFKKIVGMRFSSNAKLKEWILEQLNLKDHQLPDFALMESMMNEEIKNGTANVDFAIAGTFGENLFGFDYADFTIEYLEDNDNLKYITSADWNYWD